MGRMKVARLGGGVGEKVQIRRGESWKLEASGEKDCLKINDFGVEK